MGAVLKFVLRKKKIIILVQSVFNAYQLQRILKIFSFFFLPFFVVDLKKIVFLFVFFFLFKKPFQFLYFALKPAMCKLKFHICFRAEKKNTPNPILPPTPLEKKKKKKKK